jgi:carbamoyl-phosphate synthase large subunit
MQKNVNVLLAFCGSLATGPNLISLLKQINNRSVRVVGVDLDHDCAGRYLVDEFYKCPDDKEQFVQFVKEVCLKEKIDIILCTSTENSLLPLKRNEEEFEKIGVKIPGSSYEKISLVSDKGTLLQQLSRSGLPTAQFKTPRTIKEFNDSLKQLGYPDKLVVVKPRVASGNRGFKILKNDHKVTYKDMNSKFNAMKPYITADQYMDIISLEETFPELVLMEYLPGQDYSVYCLAKEGGAQVVIPFKRLKPSAGVSYISQVDMRADVIELARQAIEYFGLEWNINIQMRISAAGIPLIYEINPRLAGSITLTAAANCNLVEHGINQVLGEQQPLPPPNDKTKMYRYLTELFV